MAQWRTIVDSPVLKKELKMKDNSWFTCFRKGLKILHVLTWSEFCDKIIKGRCRTNCTVCFQESFIKYAQIIQALLGNLIKFSLLPSSVVWDKNVLSTFFIYDPFSSISAKHEVRFEHIFTHTRTLKSFFFSFGTLKIWEEMNSAAGFQKFQPFPSSYLNFLYFLFSSEIMTNYSPFSLKVLSYFAQTTVFSVP